MKEVFQIFMLKNDQTLLEIPEQYDTFDLALNGLEDTKVRGKFIILTVYVKE